MNSALQALAASQTGPAANASLAVPAPASVSPAAAKLRKAAGEFEAILLQSLWKSMKETFQDPDDGSSDPALETFDDWGMQSLASAVGSSGGLGIKNMILKYLEPRVDGGAGGAAPAP